MQFIFSVSKLRTIQTQVLRSTFMSEIQKEKNTHKYQSIHKLSTLLYVLCWQTNCICYSVSLTPPLVYLLMFWHHGVNCVQVMGHGFK